MAKAKTKPALPLLLRDGNAALTAGAIRELFAHTDMQARVIADPRDTMHDKLFNAIMARVDALQAQRKGYLRVIARVKGTPPLWPVVLRAAGQSAAALLQDAGILVDDARRHLQVPGVLAVLAATLRVWQTDPGADLSATLRACDTALRRGATAAAWLGFA